MIGDGVGEMGDDLAAVNLGTGLTAKSVACGQYHTCAVLSDDTLKCWGSNFEGLLGEVTTFYDEDDDNDDDNDREDYTIGNGAGEMGDNLARVNLGTDRTVSTLALCANGFTACALLDDLSVKCWGGDGENSGVLGNGQAAATNDYIGDGLEKDADGADGELLQITLYSNESEMGDNLAAVNIGTGRTGWQITCSATEYVSSNLCTTCPAGHSNYDGQNGIASYYGDASGEDTTCRYCTANYYSLDDVCLACPAGTENDAGDANDYLSQNTECSVIYCGNDHYVSSNVCTMCPAGTTSNDDPEASGEDTECDAALCPENYYVVSNVCTACATGFTNAAGDDASREDTSCVAPPTSSDKDDTSVEDLIADAKEKTAAAEETRDTSRRHQRRRFKSEGETVGRRRDRRLDSTRNFNDSDGGVWGRSVRAGVFQDAARREPRRVRRGCQHEQKATTRRGDGVRHRSCEPLDGGRDGVRSGAGEPLRRRCHRYVE